MVTVQDVEIPDLGFGTWQLDDEVAYRSVRDALDLGYRHVDTAQMYGNERAVGRALADSDVDRDDVFVTTKVPRERAAPPDVVAAAQESLDRLDVDHIDLLLLHWPNRDTPVEATVEALAEVRERGWTRLIGVSNFPTHLLHRAADAGPVAVDQVEYHPFLGQDSVLDACREHDITLTAYSPLAHGKVVHDDTINEVAAAHGRTPAQVALKWLLDQPGVTAIPRSSSREHIAENADLGFELSPDDHRRIDELPKNRRMIDPPFAPDWD